MREGAPSATAEVVAALRATHHLYDHPRVFADPHAIDMLRWPWRLACRTGLVQAMTRAGGAGLRRTVAQVVGRSRYAEEQLEAAIARGVGQYVILGAGMDTFVHRRPDLLSGLRVFELDHPSSQAHKRGRFAALGLALPPRLELVGVDLERESVRDALARSSYDPRVPAFFSWLGTTYYLGRQAILATLRAIAACTPPASSLVLDYRVPPELVEAADRRPIARHDWFTALRGEPQFAFLPAEEVGREVQACGFVVDEDLSPRALEERYFRDRRDGLRPISNLRLIHLRRA
jgi:methyltransferase (TIGR00027 family)